MYQEELLDDIEKGYLTFLPNVNECVSTRKSNEYEEGLDSQVKLEFYKTFGKEVDVKRYLLGVYDAGTRHLFKFRSGTHATEITIRIG